MPGMGSKLALSSDGKRVITPTSETGELMAFQWEYESNGFDKVLPVPHIKGHKLQDMMGKEVVGVNGEGFFQVKESIIFLSGTGDDYRI